MVDVCCWQKWIRLLDRRYSLIASHSHRFCCCLLIFVTFKQHFSNPFILFKAVSILLFRHQVDLAWCGAKPFGQASVMLRTIEFALTVVSMKTKVLLHETTLWSGSKGESEVLYTVLC